MDYDLIVVKTLERVYKNYYYIIRGYKDKEKLYMSRQQNKRTIGSSKSCVDLIFHPPKKKLKKECAAEKKT